MYLKIRSKNHTANALRNVIDTGNKRVVFRLGSLTPTEDVFPISAKNGIQITEINTTKACHNSGDKILMKQCFFLDNVKTAEWEPLSRYELMDGYSYAKAMEEVNLDPFPAIIKHMNSSKGNGIYFIETEDELNDFINSHRDLHKYIIEKYYNYSKEYRLHVTKDGCFYACRKMLKRDAEVRWHRHDMNSVWIVEENELFDKPKNWDSIVEECVKALKSVGLDIGACDVKVQTSKNKPENHIPEFIILEINSAPSLGEITTEKYINKLKEMINEI